MFSRQLVDAVTDVLPIGRGKDGRGRPRLACLCGKKPELEGRERGRERVSEREGEGKTRGDRWIGVN